MKRSRPAALPYPILALLSTPAWSRAVGRAARLPLPHAVRTALFEAYARRYGVDLSELAQPLERYATFNDFFTRALRPGARPLPSDPAAIVFPADGRLLGIGPVQGGALPPIKGHRYDVASLIGDRTLAPAFENGAYFAVYLSPGDYHRVHAPVGGSIVAVRHRSGRLFPVQPDVLERVPGLLARNERLTVVIDSDRFYGRVAVVLVGATHVGSITTAFDSFRTNVGWIRGGGVDYAQPIRIERGAELARFNLGSTVVVLTESSAWKPVEGLEPGVRVRVREAAGYPNEGARLEP